jgi:hypothetical protein
VKGSCEHDNKLSGSVKCWDPEGPDTGQLELRFSMVFFGPKANAELVSKFHVALHASHAAQPMVILKISPYSNVTLTSDFHFGLAHPVHGRYE